MIDLKIPKSFLLRADKVIESEAGYVEPGTKRTRNRVRHDVGYRG